MTAEHQPDDAARAVAEGVFARMTSPETTATATARFSLRGDVAFQVVDADATELARSMGLELPPEDDEVQPRYARVAFSLDAALPVAGAYMVVSEPETGETAVCAVLAVDGQDCDLALPAHGLLAVWQLADLIDGEATA